MFGGAGACVQFLLLSSFAVSSRGDFAVGERFHFVTEKRTYDDAKLFCSEHFSGHLASFDSDDELTELLTQARTLSDENAHYWIDGVADEPTYWTNESAFDGPTYVDGEGRYFDSSSSGDPRCPSVSVSSDWFLDDCDFTNEFICEADSRTDDDAFAEFIRTQYNIPIQPDESLAQFPGVQTFRRRSNNPYVLVPTGRFNTDDKTYAHVLNLMKKAFITFETIFTICNSIVDELDRTFGKTWHCFMYHYKHGGGRFACQGEEALIFTKGDYAVVIFRCCNPARHRAHP